ncbi:hypothetical protein [Actinoplanes cyaneus]|uniref:hypothetical protein n=2 Tax=Actinoplanes cyaneus TaxID=52696 RepID=UPI002227AD98|nr:hypothetical protein [Actinoplanes cyaneus]
MSAGLAALLCLGAVGTIVALYDKATEIPRSDPNVVMANFLGAYLVNQSDQDAALYTCKESSGLGKLSSFRDEIKRTEKANSVDIVVSWRNLAVQIDGSHASAVVEIVRSVASGVAESFDPWNFQLLDDGGWRVCSASPA